MTILCLNICSLKQYYFMFWAYIYFRLFKKFLLH
uniref:Uncharacterized protein n=1 Tax=Vertebrata australis TaxID=1967852 RepID=A0A1Z1MIG4_9FLOR|nr:hypothetical protein [Vertebrata australis]ARW65858.1 hypothetical protein [Vertebrata australis]